RKTGRTNEHGMPPGVRRIPVACDPFSNSREAQKMSVTRESLSKEFQLLKDEELLDRFHSGDLTELAHEVAAAELQRRGIDLAMPKAGAGADEPVDKRSETIEGDLVLLARFETPLQGHVLKGRLDAEGVPAIIADANIVGTNPLLS